MRPVNLIPPEERRGDRAPLRTGAVPYILVGALAVALLGVTAVVFTGKQIDDREAEKASLEVRQAEATARANALVPYAQFAQLSEARQATVTSLAHSRFDWERVLRELALVIPGDVWLTGMEALGSGGDSGGSVAGPSLTITGCGAGHEAVARFLEALKDIDGVTRVGLENSEKESGSSTSGGGSGGGDGSGADCRTRDFIAMFQVVAAFDEAPAIEPGAIPEEAGAPAEGATPVEADPGVAEARAEEQAVRDSTKKQTKKSRDAVDTLIPGVAR